MILSVVIHLQPAERGVLPAGQGRALDALFRSWIKEVDEHLWADLHPERGKKNNAPATQPYTISNLHGPEGQGENLYLEPGIPLWWRVTSLDPAFSCFVLDLLRYTLEQEDLHFIGSHPFYLIGFDTDPKAHPWAGSTTYDELLRTCLMSKALPPDKFRLVFDSPTYFDDQDKVTPFPLPELVVQQWRKKWNARKDWLSHWPARDEWLAKTTESNQFIPVDEGILEFAQTSLGASRYDLETTKASYFKTSFIGFTGTCSYKILNSDPVWSRWLHTLVNFAFYCGTGGKTSFGFGQTRML